MSTDVETAFELEDFLAPPPGCAPAGVIFADEFDDFPDQAEAPTNVDLAETPVAEDVAPAEVLTAEDLAAAREAAFAEGVQHGLDEAAGRAALAAETALMALRDALAASAGEARKVMQAAGEAVTRTALGALGALLPVYCAAHGPAEAEALAACILPMLTCEPRLVVYAHPRLLPRIEAIVAGLDDAARSQMRLLARPDMAESDLRIEWQDGSAIRDSRAVLARLRDTLTIGAADGKAVPVPKAPEFAGNYEIKELIDA